MNLNARILKPEDLEKLLDDIQESYLKAKMRFVPSFVIKEDLELSDGFLKELEINMRRGNLWVCFLSVTAINISKVLCRLRCIHYVCVCDEPKKLLKTYDKKYNKRIA